jgi:hypothetical protein
MKRLLDLAWISMVFSTSAMAGSIDVGGPLVSGSVITTENKDRISQDLTSGQLQSLSQWLDQHRSGWQGMVTPASSEPRRLEIRLKHSDGSTTSVCVIDRAGGGHYVRLTGPGTWAYRSWGGIVKSWAAVRPLSDLDLVALTSIAAK